MLDGWAKKKIDPALLWFARRLVKLSVGANQVTFAGFAIGILAATAISFEFFLVGLALIGLSRTCDGLDGAIARITKKTDIGGYLDIVLDFAFYGAIPLGFVFVDPHANAVAGAVLIFSFYVNGASFLAYAIMAEKRGLINVQRGSKSLFFSTGLAEAVETFGFFAAICFFPSMFATLSWFFAFICIYTAVSRIYRAMNDFAD